MAEQKLEAVLTPKFRAAFTQVFKPKAFEAGKEAKYSICMLFDKEAQATPEYKKMRELVAQAMTAKFGAKEKWPKNWKNPFRDGNEKADEYQGFADTVFVSASSKFAPGLIDQQKNDIIDPDAFYSGCFARAQVNVYAFDHMGNKGVAFGLQNIQKLKDGEKLGGRASAQSVFDEVEVTEDLNNLPNYASSSDSDF
jgi:hypothetical protein